MGFSVQADDLCGAQLVGVLGDPLVERSPHPSVGPRTVPLAHLRGRWRRRCRVPLLAEAEYCRFQQALSLAGTLVGTPMLAAHEPAGEKRQ